MAGGKFKAGGLNLGAEFGYGSGDDPNSSSSDIDTFIQSTNARVQYRTYIYSARTATTAGAGGAWTSNILWLGATAGGPITDALSFKAGLYYLAAAEDARICPQCDAIEDAGGSVSGDKNDDEVGIEIDASVNYQLARNLRLWAEGGYLLVGDAFQKVSATNVAESGDDAYGIRIGTEMSF
jgi:predicted porin